MTDSPSWNRVKKVFQTALEQQPVDRAAFVRRACEEDPALFGEVESLLAAFERADAFIERPVLAALTPSAALAAGQAVDRTGRALQPGAALGQYEVIEFVGAGGMGEVCRARDRRLNRDVALKIRSGPRAFDADRLERLTREAHLLAALNHPNIAAIYGLEEARRV